jgi:hypothetical protein
MAEDEAATVKTIAIYKNHRMMRYQPAAAAASGPPNFFRK